MHSTIVNSEGLSCLATSIASSLMTSHRPEPAAKALDSSKHAMFYYACFLALVAVHSVDGRNKRELPLSYNCDPRQYGSCAKADLVSTSVADCKRSRWWQTCKPINDYALSSVVDIPDSSRASCNPVNGLPIRCGSEYDTRCVCDKAVDYKRPKETLFNQCRCQYWPAVDSRKAEPSFCTQYDHGGVSGVHFFTCCNNCNDQDTSCSGLTYQGGGSSGNYCNQCGNRSTSDGLKGRPTYRYNCASCSQQLQCQNICNQKFISTKVPGFCPYWSGCFRGCCRKAAANRKRQTNDGIVDVGMFCGDRVCQTGEDGSNCPVDCCPNVNPDACRQNCSNPSCCLEPRCCMSTSSVTSNHLNFTLCLLLGLSVFIFS